MGFLTNTTNEVIIDAILTKAGRQKLASQGTLGIVKFALSDDEVDYSLYNVDNPAGSDYYDVALRKMPILEALPASEDALKYKLFTNTTSVTQNVLSLTISADAKIRNSDGTTGTGIDSHDSYDIIVNLSNSGLLPASIKDNVYYTAKLTSYEGRGINWISFTGAIPSDANGQLYNSIVRAQSDIANRALQSSGVPSSIEAAGKWFTFKVLDESAIITPLQFRVIIQAAGAINATAADFIIPVSPMAAITVTTTA